MSVPKSKYNISSKTLDILYMNIMLTVAILTGYKMVTNVS